MTKLVKFLIFSTVFILFLLLASGHIDSIDGMAYLNIARNIVNKGDFSVAPAEYNTGMFVSIGVDGKTYSHAGLGYALAFVPVAFITKVIYQINSFTPVEFFPLQSDYLLTFLASFVNPILGFFLFVVLYKLLNHIAQNEKTAFIVALVTVFSTNLLPLSKHTFPHILFILLALSCLYFLLRFIAELKLKHIVISGFFAGLLAITYNLTFILPLGMFGLFLIYHLIKLKLPWKKSLVSLGLWVTAILPFLFLLLEYNRIRFGGFFNTGLDLNSSGDFGLKAIMFEGMWGLLFSPGRSVAVFSPIFVVAIFSALNNWKNDVFSKLFLGLTAVYLVFYSSFAIWSGELSYGPRYLAFLIPFAGLVIAANWQKINKLVLSLFVVIGLYVQLVGITIPYQTQYQAYDLSVYSLPKIIDRKVMFEIYGIGEFFPRYSPPYRLKRVLVRRIKEVGDILAYKQNPIDFVKNVSFPVYPENYGRLPGRPYKHASASFNMYANQPMEFKDIYMEIGAVNQPITSLKICVETTCYAATQVTQQGNNYSFSFEKTFSLQPGSVLNFVLNENLITPNDFELDLYGMAFDNQALDIGSYSLVNRDWFFTRGTPYHLATTNFDDLWHLRNNEFEALNNVTPDFWWIKAKIYYNLPIYFMGSFYALVALLALCVITFLFIKLGQIFMLKDQAKKLLTLDFLKKAPKLNYPLHPLTEQQAKKVIAKYSYWYQRIDLGNGVYTMEIGPAFHEMVWAAFRKIFPSNLKKASVLDIGTNAGYFPIEFKKLNAGRTVGLEFAPEFFKQAEEIKKIYGLEDIEYLKKDAHQVAELKERFDIVIFTGILYHLKNPLQVIEDVAKKCKDVILIETEAIPLEPKGFLWTRQGFPPVLKKCEAGFMKLVEGRDLNNDPTNWWIPDTECVKGMLRTAGFKYFSQPFFIAETRLVIAATKEKSSLVNLKKLGPN